MDSLNLSQLREEITDRMLREVVEREVMAMSVPPHNAGSGIVVNWDPNNRLPDLELGHILPSAVRLQEQACDLCRKWCKLGLVNATDEELDAAIHGKKIIQWYRFEKQCNLPTSKNLLSSSIRMHAWDAFQEECFNRLVGWRDP